MSKHAQVTLVCCLFCVMLGGWISSLGSEPSPKIVTVTVTKPAKVITKTVIVPGKMPESCTDLLDTMSERNALMTRYQAEVVAPLGDIPNDLSAVGYGGPAQPAINDIQARLIKINNANTDIQVELHENEQHLSSQTKACEKETR